MGVAAHKQAYSLASRLLLTCIAAEATTKSTAVVETKFELAAAKHALALAAAVGGAGSTASGCAGCGVLPPTNLTAMS